MNNTRLVRALPVALFLCPLLSACSHAQTGVPATATANPPLFNANFDTPTGTQSGDATFSPGISGNALTLNGTGSVELTQSLDTSKSYTVMAWVKVGKVGGFQTYISSDGPKNSAFFLQLRDDTKHFAFTGLPEGDGEANFASGQDDVETGVWYHLAGVYDATKKTMSLYVNGVLQDSVPFTGAYKAPGPVRLGRAKFDGNPVDFASGQLDDTQIFQSALSGAQILAIARPLLGTPGTAPAIVPASLSVDISKVRAQVSPLLYGLMTEEINHAYDGGLYGELLQNRTFQDNAEKTPHWSLVRDGGTGSMSLDSSQPASAALPKSLKLQITDAKNGRVGVSNDGYWGVPIRPQTRYTASFWARVSPDWKGPLTVELESADGKTRYAGATVKVAGTDWKKYTVTLSTGQVAATTDGRFTLSSRGSGTIWLNLVSLFPPTYKNRPNGNRVDLSEKMAAMKPQFLRFPGGNYLEGNTIAERFDWKKTLGPLENRPGHMGPWGYRSTDGMGLLEFLGWCDDLNMEPVLAVYAGYSLRGDHIAPGPELEPFVQDALDEIEFVTGDQSTKWGKVRAQLGHPKPWKLQYVEIGNEDFFDRSGSYDGRFAQFYDAIKAKYPQLQLISTTMDARTRVKSRKPDLIDEHYYADAREMERKATLYDKYDRNGPKIFVGEWAAYTERVPWQDPQQLNAPTPNMAAALGDAAFMTGMERNSDIVKIQCYAPLFVNVNSGGRQWAPNLLGYNNLVSYGAPSYHAQVMFANNLGDVALDSTLNGGRRLNSSVTRDTKSGALFVKVVNPMGYAQSVKMTIGGAKSVSNSGVATVLQSSGPKDTNSLAQPTKIVPVTKPISNVGADFSYEAPPFSISVLKLNAK
ncbi:extracellular exo-alpha-L-arabinofuranosidase [Abditibacteriota bacterium]|nr:extracellular exo-alpha-L-arabinofuranosidase [Abditibacteriota bacterium]